MYVLAPGARETVTNLAFPCFSCSHRLITTQLEKGQSIPRTLALDLATDDYRLHLVTLLFIDHSIEVPKPVVEVLKDFFRAFTFSNLARSLVGSPNPRGPNLHPSSVQATSKLPKSRTFGHNIALL